MKLQSFTVASDPKVNSRTLRKIHPARLRAMLSQKINAVLQADIDQAEQKAAYYERVGQPHPLDQQRIDAVAHRLHMVH